MFLVDVTILQLGDLQAHLDHVKDYINQKVDPEFSGLGVLDFEEWFAIWDMNFWSSKGEYRRASIDLAAQKHPGLTQAEIEGIAKEDFDRAARLEHDVMPEKPLLRYWPLMRGIHQLAEL